MKKVTIVGAGISGLSAARLLSHTADVELLDKANKVGGLIKCDYVAGNLFHKVGGHVFNSRNKEVFDWFWSPFDIEKEFLKTTRKAKILYNGKFIGYPLENHLYEFDKELVVRVISELMEIQKKNVIHPLEYENFEDFLRGNFGDTLYKLYFKPYNQKIWNTDLSKVALEWLDGKLPMPNIKDIFISNIVKEEESAMVHATFYYPKSGGSQFIANRLSEGLQIKTGVIVDKIEKQNETFIINDAIYANTIVYTADVRELADIIKTNDTELQAALENVRNLKSNGTSNLFCECDNNDDLSWLYIPEDFTKAHRIIYTGNFSPSNNQGSERKTCVVEFSGKVEPELMEEEIKKLPGNLLPLSYNYEPNSYVIQEKDTRQKINCLKEQLEKYDFYLVGRFAEWEYYNMDKAIEASLKLSQKLSPKEINLHF